jgi:hypothetical protein
LDGLTHFVVHLFIGDPAVYYNENQQRKYGNTPIAEPAIDVPMTRRTLVRRSFATGVALFTPGFIGALVSACSEVTNPTRDVTIDLSTEVGVLNFCYALLQLEADFYTRVTDNIFPGMLNTELDQFNSFFGGVAGAAFNMPTAIPSHRITDIVVFRLGQVVDFSSRSSVLTNAQTIEDACAQGYLSALSMVHSADAITLVQGLSDAAIERSAALRTMAGAAPLMIAAQPPEAVMAALASYYLTTFTIHT